MPDIPSTAGRRCGRRRPGVPQPHKRPRTVARQPEDTREALSLIYCIGLSTYHLCCAGGQQLQVVPLVARDTPGQQDGIGPGIHPHELQEVLPVLLRELVGWEPLGVAMHPADEAICEEVFLQGLET